MSKYAQIYEPSHPLAHSLAGQVFMHRKVLYDEIGEGIHQCHVCSGPLDWFAIAAPKLVVDHIERT